MSHTKKRIAVLGSTGSIGQQTLEVIRALPDQFQVVALAAGNNIDLLAKQVKEFQPNFICCQDRKMNSNLTGSAQSVSLEEMASLSQADTVVIATSGKSGLSPTLAAIKAHKNIALANKEALVMAGEIITSEAKLNHAQILPIDSEHSAIWQCLRGETQPANRLILTASGGPFLNHSQTQLNKVTIKEALTHPTWKMGKKITIDSATLMNKGLEIIEAHWLFNMPFDRISVLLHPQSIIHSMVEFTDGAIKAQLSCPDMRLPIQYALTYPERLSNTQLPTLDWNSLKCLTFEQPDLAKFPCLRLATEAGTKGGTYPAVLCAADEVAVDLFLAERIKFNDIAALVEHALALHSAVDHPTLDEILAADTWARQTIMNIFKDRS